MLVYATPLLTCIPSSPALSDPSSRYFNPAAADWLPVRPLHAMLTYGCVRSLPRYITRHARYATQRNIIMATYVSFSLIHIFFFSATRRMSFSLTYFQHFAASYTAFACAAADNHYAIPPLRLLLRPRTLFFTNVTPFASASADARPLS